MAQSNHFEVVIRIAETAGEACKHCSKAVFIGQCIYFIGVCNHKICSGCWSAKFEELFKVGFRMKQQKEYKQKARALVASCNKTLSAIAEE